MVKGHEILADECKLLSDRMANAAVDGSGKLRLERCDRARVIQAHFVGAIRLLANTFAALSGLRVPRDTASYFPKLTTTKLPVPIYSYRSTSVG